MVKTNTGPVNAATAAERIGAKINSRSTLPVTSKPTSDVVSVIAVKPTRGNNGSKHSGPFNVAKLFILIQLFFFVLWIFS